jgi:hypothetical protein
MLLYLEGRIPKRAGAGCARFETLIDRSGGPWRRGTNRLDSYSTVGE